MNIKLNLSTILIVGVVYFLFIRRPTQNLISGGIPIPDDMTPQNNSYGA